MMDPGELFAELVAIGDFDEAAIALDAILGSKFESRVALFAIRWAEGDEQGARRAARMADCALILERLNV